MEKTELTDAFWAEAKSAGVALGDDYWVRRMGGNRETVDIIVKLVLSGDKTGTFGVQLLQDLQPEIKPMVGMDSVMINMDGKPQGILKTTQLIPVSYKDITEEHLLVEGPGARKLKVWQDIHWPYWAGTLEQKGLEPSEDMVIVVEHFDLIYPQ